MAGSPEVGAESTADAGARGASTPPESDAGAAADGQSDVLEALAESFLERHRRGETPTISEYADRHPELADRIHDLFPMLLLMDRVGSLEAGALTRSGEWTVPKLTRLGDYVIKREIGRGGMGIVYEAEQVSLKRRVALKVLPRHALYNPTQLERFQREAHAAARLSHPNIVGVYAFGSEGGVHYLAMQYVRSRSLDAVIEELRRLRAGEPARVGESDSDLLTESPTRDAYFRSVAGLVAQGARALAYAHSEGIVHRDVKPSNLLLDPDGRLWITDFGLAKDASAERLTESGAILGTMAYMAPERFRGGGGPSSDVYGLGLCLYELATLHLAFDACEGAKLMRRIVEEEPTRPRRLDPDVPADLETVIWKAIRKDPEQRYGSAADLAEDLERFQRGEPIRARLPRLPSRAARVLLRHRWAAALLLLLVLGGVAGISRWITSAGKPQGPSDLLACDVDGHGQLTVIAVSKGSGHVSIVPAGEHGAGGVQSFFVGGKPQPARLADLDGDGSEDLALPLLEDSAVLLLFGDGQGGFDSESRLPVDEPPYGVECGDWDGDRDVDLAVVGGKKWLWVFDNVGGGEFERHAPVEVSPNPSVIASADFDGDLLPDLVVVHPIRRTVSIITHDAQGAFSKASTRALKLDRIPLRVAVGDFDGDGLPDLATANLDSSACILLNSAAGGFGSVRDVPLPGAVQHIVAADFDRDGDVDLVLVGSKANLFLLRNDGQAAFAVDRMQCGDRPTSSLPFDWDGDGDLDLLVSNYGSGDLSFVRNDGPRQFAEAGRIALAR